jgi:hypothetical protein
LRRERHFSYPRDKLDFDNKPAINTPTYGQSYLLYLNSSVQVPDKFNIVAKVLDRLCGLVVGVLGYRSRGPVSIPGTTRKKKVVGLERGPLSLVSINEELLDRKVTAPV